MGISSALRIHHLECAGFEVLQLIHQFFLLVKLKPSECRVAVDGGVFQPDVVAAVHVHRNAPLSAYAQEGFQGLPVVFPHLIGLGGLSLIFLKTPGLETQRLGVSLTGVFGVADASAGLAAGRPPATGAPQFFAAASEWPF